MADEVKHFEENTDEKKLYEPLVKMPSDSLETKSTEDATESFVDGKKLSMEQKLKFADVQRIENQMKKELQKKHQQELREHILRQKKEMQELQNQLKLANEPLAFEGGDNNVAGTSFSCSQQATLDPSAVSKMDVKCKEVVGANVPDVPLSPELSPPVAELSKCDEGVYINGKLISNGQDIIRDLREFSLNDNPCEKFLSTNDILSSQSAGYNSRRTSKLKHPQNGFQMRQFSSNREVPKNPRLNMHLFKTEVCRTWTKFGLCPYGENCRFAHGLRELRRRPVKHRKFRPVICKNFLAGHCPYGARCHFLHDVFEQRISGSNYAPNWTGRYGYGYGDNVPRSSRGMYRGGHWGRHETLPPEALRYYMA